jgi:hypothetical protein
MLHRTGADWKISHARQSVQLKSGRMCRHAKTIANDDGEIIAEQIRRPLVALRKPSREPTAMTDKTEPAARVAFHTRPAEPARQRQNASRQKTKAAADLWAMGPGDLHPNEME